MSMSKEFLQEHQIMLDKADDSVYDHERTIEDIKSLAREMIEKEPENIRWYELLYECYYLRSEGDDWRDGKLMPPVPFELFVALQLRYEYYYISPKKENALKQLIEKYGIASQCYHVYSYRAIDKMEEDPDYHVVYAFAVPRGSSYIERCFEEDKMEDLIAEWVSKDSQYDNKPKNRYNPCSAPQ